MTIVPVFTDCSRESNLGRLYEQHPPITINRFKKTTITHTLSSLQKNRAYMIIGVPQECAEGECRVAASPASVKKLIGLGYDVHVQTGAGDAANFPDAATLPQTSTSSSSLSLSLSDK